MAFGHSLQEGSHLLNTCRLPWGGVTALDALEAFMEVPPQLLDTWLPPSPLPPPPPSPRAHLSLADIPPSPAPHAITSWHSQLFISVVAVVTCLL